MSDQTRIIREFFSDEVDRESDYWYYGDPDGVWAKLERASLTEAFDVPGVGLVQKVAEYQDYSDYQGADNDNYMVYSVGVEFWRVDGRKDSYGNSTWYQNAERVYPELVHQVVYKSQGN